MRLIIYDSTDSVITRLVSPGYHSNIVAHAHSAHAAFPFSYTVAYQRFSGASRSLHLIAAVTKLIWCIQDVVVYVLWVLKCTMQLPSSHSRAILGGLVIAMYVHVRQTRVAGHNYHVHSGIHSSCINPACLSWLKPENGDCST